MEKNIYKIVHYHNIDQDKQARFIETEMDASSIIKLLAAISFKYEELVDAHGDVTEDHLMYLFETFFGINNVTKKYEKYLPHTYLDKNEWGIVNEMSVKDDNFDDIKITQIDWFGARESCCGPDYTLLMKNALPDTKDFEDAIREDRFYRENKVVIK
ncbi:hypothetical protein [Bacillus sp. 1P06AnD]|uniref:hypothetical protein n=1 Tax=Bacillus sp. 1P06AnD TaxID=3132208 RepID=UPI0039A13ACF